MTQKRSDSDPIDVPAATQQEMTELKREMRSAEWNDWFIKNQQSMLVAVGLVLAGLVAGGMWLEHSRSQHDAAATLYQQAVNETDAARKKAMLEGLIREFSSSSYAAMAEMQLPLVDTANAEAHLQALMDNSAAMDEWRWQARLDLAQLKIEQGDAAAAHTLLEQPVGKQYQQLRFFLLAMIATDTADKKQQLQKALDAAAPDPALKQRIETQLSLLAS
ncbi:MAG: hypothetical protein COW18_01155 [Zetaproteobacteria bacterium CG12_big_fil_rev_8_21_14_0_65_54_13]|nr:MAG: hypothetical protein COW18_01155 [Zetaproteobacteria bacterium CG12_big_fil_rev_8_21_14_0_65_54_13]PIX55728.1 MAG: hypothetical protein COZ50_01145 [Zetaproteobacteria bacterium CG_4_10_14_3_um_filter_54_28]PJA30540.1 MAG: hypothetical protein CO188_03055 [Zetaproteobacteria bacterium CG_4_9_14_3_um_filter_54_145]